MKLFLVGGFLGSGKTTAIHGACASFLKQEKKMAVITNDQGADLVDTAYLKTAGVETAEVINGCFCCNYNQFAEAINSLREKDEPEIIFAESVGSCTDLIATIAKPLEKFNPEITVVISVFADAPLLYSLMAGNSSFLNDHVRYIYKKQLEEADILIVNKIDLLSDLEIKEIATHLETEYPGKTLLYQNSLEEDSIGTWILLLNRFQSNKARKSLDLNYDSYAKGEAALAWVDQRITVETKDGNAHSVATKFIKKVYSNIKDKYLIAHLKFLLDDGANQHKISFTTLDDNPDEIILTDNRKNKVSILLNARIQAEFAEIEQLILESIQQTSWQTGSKIIIHKKAAFQPAYPRPTHRL